MPLRLLIFLAIGIWALVKISSYITGRSSDQVKGRNRKNHNNSNVNVDSKTGKENRKGKYSGGEYVDYKEVK